LIFAATVPTTHRWSKAMNVQYRQKATTSFAPGHIDLSTSWPSPQRRARRSRQHGDRNDIEVVHAASSWVTPVG
jgi:hypothetical protein